MNSQFDLANPQKNYLYLCEVDSESDLELFLQDLQALENLGASFSFDRSLWAKLSSGYIPPQLYDFNFDSGVNFMILSEKPFDNKSTFRSFEIKLSEIQVSGKFEASEFTEEDFQGSAYLTFMRTSNSLEDVTGALKLSFMGNHLFISEEMFAVDDLAQKKKASLELCQCFFLPSKELFSELPDLLKDKEKIHLSENLTGIRC